jgi:HK97 family phage prohead protease
MDKKELRTLSTAGVELRNDDATDDNYVYGLGVVYNKPEELWDGYIEEIDRDAFTECFAKNPKISCYFNHSDEMVLSTTESNPPLVLTNTADGLIYSAAIPNTTYGKNLIENLKRGNIGGSSFAFNVKKDDVSVGKDGKYYRKILVADLFEIGPVVVPAFQATTAALRNKEWLFQEAEKRCADVKKDIVDVAFIDPAKKDDWDYICDIVCLAELDNN